MKKLLYLLVLLSFTIAISSCGGGNNEKNKGNITPEQNKLPEVSSLEVTAPAEGNKLALSWKMPDDSKVTGVIIVRKEKSEPADLSDGTKIFEGKATGYTDTGLTNGVKYFYRVATEDGKGHFSKGVVASGTPEDTLPPPEVSDFKVTAPPQGGELILTWKNPEAPEFQGVVVVRKEGMAPLNKDDGAEVYTGKGTTYTDSGLENGKFYFYRIFTYDDDGNYSDGVVSGGVPEDVPPPSVSNFTAIHDPAGNAISLSWENPTVEDFTGVTILRKEGVVPDDCHDREAEIIYKGKGSSFYDSGLTDGVEYCYAVCATDAGGNFSDPAAACETPQDELPPGQVYGFNVTVAPEGNILKISWLEPDDSDYKGVMVLRGVGYCPQTTTDTYAGVVTIGTFARGTAYFEDDNLENDTEYCYSFFSFDEVPNFSSPATVRGTPHDSIPPSSPEWAKTAPSVFANIVAWSMPNTDDVRGYLILRKSGSYPTGPTDTDATAVLNGNIAPDHETTYIFYDYDAPKDVVNYYAIYPYDESPNYADPATARAGMILHSEKNMGVSGLFNRIVPFGKGFAIFYTSYQAREGVKVAYNSSKPDFDNLSYSVVTSSPTGYFDVVSDGEGGYYVIVSSLWEKPGIDVYHFSSDTHIQFTGEVTAISENYNTYKSLNYYNTFAALRDSVNLLHIYYFEVTDSAQPPSLTEAIFNPQSGGVVYNRGITSCESDYFPILLQAQWSSVRSRPELVYYTYNHKTTSAVIKYGYNENDSWHFTTVESSESNGGYFLTPPAMGIDGSGNVYVYYKRNTRDYFFRGILKEYTYSTVVTRTFREEMSQAKKVLFNQSRIVFKENDWEILTYQEVGSTFPPQVTFIELNGIYLDSGTPTTATVEFLNVTSLSPDFPLVGVLQTDGFVDSDNNLFVTGWLGNLKVYKGTVASNSFDPNNSGTIETNPDTHWALWGRYPETTGFNYQRVGDSSYFVGTGYEMGSVNSHIYVDYEDGSSPVMMPQFSSPVVFFDSAFDSFSQKIYILGKSGSDLYIWYGDPVNGFSSKEVAPSANPVNGAIDVYGSNIGIVYVDNGGDLHYCLSNSGINNLSCNSLGLSTVDNRWVDIAYSPLQAEWYIAFRESGNLIIWGYNGLNSEFPLNDSRGYAPYFYISDDRRAIGLIYYRESPGYYNFHIYWILAPSGSGWSNRSNVTLTPCDSDKPDSVPFFSVDNIKPPQLVSVPDATGGTAFDVIYQGGSGNMLMMGLQIKDTSRSCWYYNIPISLISNSDSSVYRVRGSFSTGVNQIRTGYMGFIPYRISGTGFVEDIFFSR